MIDRRFAQKSIRHQDGRPAHGHEAAKYLIERHSTDLIGPGDNLSALCF